MTQSNNTQIVKTFTDETVHEVYVWLTNNKRKFTTKRFVHVTLDIGQGEFVYNIVNEHRFDKTEYGYLWDAVGGKLVDDFGMFLEYAKWTKITISCK